VLKGVLTWLGLFLGIAGIIAFVYGLTVLISNGNCGCSSDGFCSGPACPPADGLGFLGLFAGIWVSIGGFILMGVARAHGRVQQWRSQFAGGTAAYANMSRANAYGVTATPGLTFASMASGATGGGTGAMAGLGPSADLIAQLMKVRAENSANPAAAQQATLDLLRNHGYSVPTTMQPGSVFVAPAGQPSGAAPMSAEAILARDAQTGLPGMQAAPGDATGRLGELDALHKQGVVNDDEYAAQRKRILDSI
jgi:hypothetical protein